MFEKTLRILFYVLFYNNIQQSADRFITYSMLNPHTYIRYSGNIKFRVRFAIQNKLKIT